MYSKVLAMLQLMHLQHELCYIACGFCLLCASSDGMLHSTVQAPMNPHLYP
jgi:hypothetical protein